MTDEDSAAELGRIIDGIGSAQFQCMRETTESVYQLCRIISSLNNRLTRLENLAGNLKDGRTGPRLGYGLGAYYTPPGLIDPYQEGNL